MFAHEVEFVLHLYLLILIITLYLLKISDIFYAGLSGKTIYYDETKLIRTQNLSLAQLILHVCDKAGIAVAILVIILLVVILVILECFSYPNSGEYLKRNKRKKSTHVSQKCTKSQARIEFSFNSYVTGPSCKLVHSKCPNVVLPSIIIQHLTIRPSHHEPEGRRSRYLRCTHFFNILEVCAPGFALCRTPVRKKRKQIPREALLFSSSKTYLGKTQSRRDTLSQYVFVITLL